MFKSKRALALALASFGLINAADLPMQSGAPVLSAPAIQINAEPVEIDLPAASEFEGADHAPASDMPLGQLVSTVASYGDVELDEDMRCLASAVYNEARGEPLEGQLAVAQVVLNRAADPRWPSSICEVVYQRYQFSFTFDGAPDFPAPNRNWKKAEAVAIIAATEHWNDLTDKAVFYHANYVSPKWRHAFRKTTRIGQHIFYR